MTTTACPHQHCAACQNVFCGVLTACVAGDAAKESMCSSQAVSKTVSQTSVARNRSSSSAAVPVSVGLSSAVVFLVHPSSDPSPSKLQLLIPPLAAGCHCLVAINGPSRVEGLITAATGLNTRGPASALTGEGLGLYHSARHFCAATPCCCGRSEYAAIASALLPRDCYTASCHSL